VARCRAAQAGQTSHCWAVVSLYTVVADSQRRIAETDLDQRHYILADIGEAEEWRRPKARKPPFKLISSDAVQDW
jgi:hypothetical protein